MSLQFTKVNDVGVDDPITSTQHNRLATAINERILSGIGDFTPRLAHWALNLVTQIRNPVPLVEGAFLWPAADEWLQVYAHLPWDEGLVWPDAEPGDEEGVNLNNPLGALIHGAAWAGITNEVDRIVSNLIALPTIDSPETDAFYWEAGKQQRGAFDPGANVSIAPARDAALSHYTIGYPNRNFYGKTYGGFFGSPEPLGDCEDSTAPANPKFRIRFTPKSQYAGEYSVREFDCCCGPGVSGTIAGYWGTRHWWLIMTWGTDPLTGADVALVTELLSKEVYVEGPYTSGGYLRRDEGGQLEHVLFEYVKTLRGSDAQKKGGVDVEDVGFDWQKFFERTYLLAPAYGSWDEGTETLTANYQTWEVTTEVVNAGLVGDPYDAHDGFTIAGWFIKVHLLVAPLVITLVEQTTGDRSSVTISPSPDDSKILWLDSGTLAGRWQPRIESASALSPGGSILIQLAELQAIKPELVDAYIVARTAMSLGGASDDQDEMGDAFEYAKAASDAYFARGCLSGRGITGVDHINRSVLHEAARRMINRHLRLAGKGLIRGYRVNEDGDSELTFKRNVLMEARDLDVFRGIAPDPDAVISNIRPEIEYEVRDGPVIYDGIEWAIGERFFGVLGQVDFERPAGSSGNVYEHNILSDIGLQDGESNAWVLHCTFNLYHTSDSSLWKLDNYDNSLRHPNRCHTYSELIQPDKELNQHFSYLQSPILWSDAVPGHTYAKGIQPETLDDDVRLAHYCSCRIYPAPYKVKRAEHFEVGGEKRVRIVLDGRLHHRDGDWYPTDEETETWDGPAIAAYHEESYRTDENGIIEWLWHQNTGTNAQPLIGDYAQNAGVDVTELPDNPFAAIVPRIWFTKLVPLVYEDGESNVENDKDTICSADQLTDMARYLSIMCEGWVDTKSSQDLSCRSGSTLIDFTASNLWLQASEGTMTGFPILPFEYRPDTERAQGVGTLPNTLIHHDHYNLLANAVNLLYRARLEIPIKSRQRTLSYHDDFEIGPTNGAGTDSCADIGGRWWDNLAIPQASTLQDTGAWSDWSDGVAGLSYAITHTASFRDIPTCTLRVAKQAVELEIAIANEQAACAVPAAIQELLADGSFTVFGVRAQTIQLDGYQREISDAATSQLCDFAEDGTFRPFFDEQGYYIWTGGQDEVTSPCREVVATDAVPSIIEASDFYQGGFPPAGGNPGGFCGSVVGNRVEFNPEAQSVPMLQVPLVDPDAPQNL